MNFFFSKFSSKAGGHAPQNPLEVTFGNSRKTLSKCSSRILLYIQNIRDLSLLKLYTICPFDFLFQNFLQKLGGMPPRPPLKLLVATARTHKISSRYKMCNQYLKASWTKHVVQCPNLFIEQSFFQFFFKSWGAGPPDPP